MSKTAIVWSCAHTDPEVSNERFNWLGDLIEDIKPDYTVDLGDGADMKSLNSYDTRYPQAIVAQSYERDIEHYNEAMDRLWGRYRISKKKRPTRIGFEGNHECFQGHTEIFTRTKGWVKAPDVSLGDEVMSLEGSWTKVLQTHKLYHEGPMVGYKSQTGVFSVTPNHRVFYYNSSGTLSVKKASDTPKELDLPTSTNKVGPVEEGLTDDQVLFCAVSLTDSYHSKNKVVLYQSGDKADTIRTLLQRLGLIYREVERVRDIKEICGATLKSVQVGYEFHMERPSWCPDQNKRLPEEFFNLNAHQSQLFLEMLIFCDGSPMEDRRSSVFYGKKEICDDVQAYCILNCSQASLKEYRKNQWRVNICPRWKQRFRKLDLPTVKDWVYCITVEEGNFLARQGGVALFTGNCRITKAISLDPRLEGAKYGVSFKHLQTDHWFDEYHRYENSAPAIVDINGILHSHYFSSGNYGTAMSGMHHAYGLINKLNRSAICGHSHKRSLFFKDAAYPNPVIGMVVGCYKGKDEAWAGQANREWWRGVVVMRNIESGHFDPEFISTSVLQQTYGNK